MKEERRIYSIDFLKVIAILLVIIFHILYQINLDNSLRPIGFIGVSLFFIISGFVLANKYSEMETFSFKWFFKRYFKIAILYYIALVVIALLFSRQSYDGNLFSNLFAHFLFIDSYFPAYDYGIISPAWFIPPLICLYLLFPFLNKIIKKYPRTIFIFFALTTIFRINKDTYTSFSPFFFIADFCFGIALAYKKDILAIISCLLILLVKPIMIVPFILFLLIKPLKYKSFSSKIISIIAANTLALFLFHEAIINIISRKWAIFNLNLYFSLIIYLLSVIIAIYLSNKAQNKILSLFDNKD